jgi:YD repeat-containing protein
VASTAYNVANHQTTFGDKTLTYDNNGNLQTITDPSGTTTYTWNARNQLVGISGPTVTASFVYDGLGRRQPRMNLDGCAGCHSFPAPGGASPFVNPQVAFANKNGATNVIPSFITLDGPLREVRFIKNPDGSPDGSVHALFTISGRADAPGCVLSQPDFEAELAKKNVSFRIPTPIFGAGLIEQIPDSAVLANQGLYAEQKKKLGIVGRANIVRYGRTPGKPISGTTNTNGNDGTISRFGWKAQNQSLLLFAAEAYNVEMGATNELFQTERDETAECQFASAPNDVTNTDAMSYFEMLGDINKFAFFTRFLAPPAASSDTPGGALSVARGKALFSDIGCAYCHTPTLHTGNSTVGALRYQPVNLYSDLLLHDMGAKLADGVTQGQAGPSEFRTAPLWGLGQRIFFLHDGRTNDLLEAIEMHQSGNGLGRNLSEANAVIDNFHRLSEEQKQDLLNFLRSL